MGEINGEDLFASEISAVVKKYPKLERGEIDGKVCLKGEIDLVNDIGECQDTYLIEIFSVPEYPGRFPKVFEKGGKIPCNIDWHVFESDCHCCIKVEPEEVLICQKGISLLDFLDHQVLPYFFNQTYRRINGFFLNERSHGLLGIVEYYQEKLQEPNIHRLIDVLTFMVTKSEPVRTAKCFCGSNRKYRKCHKQAFSLIKNIGIPIVANHVLELNEIRRTVWEQQN